MAFRIHTNVAAMNALRHLNAINLELSRSTARLASGLRINSPSDDPGGFIVSENLRTQMAGIDQASRNSQYAMGFAKTADGALEEVGKLLRDARALAGATGGSSTLTASQVQANQTQLNSIMASIGRIAGSSQFGTRRLLDGSSGVVANVVDATRISAMQFGGYLGSGAILSNSSLNINVTTAATQAALTGSKSYALATTTVPAGSFSINGVTFTTTATQSISQVVDMINQSASQTGVTAALNGSNQVVLTSVGYGSNARVDLTDAGAIILSAAGAASAAGVNAVATVTAPTGGPGGTSLSAVFTGGQLGNDGLTLTDASGNMVRLTTAGNAVGAATGVGQLRSNVVQFQIGTTAAQTVTLSIGSFLPSALALSGLDITTSAGSTAAISAIEAALDVVTKTRGEVGGFVHNTIESNLRALAIARENLAASDSAIREIDAPEEMTHYTKLQLLQEAAIGVLAQANLAPQSVLALLRG